MNEWSSEDENNETVILRCFGYFLVPEEKNEEFVSKFMEFLENERVGFMPHPKFRTIERVTEEEAAGDLR